MIDDEGYLIDEDGNRLDSQLSNIKVVKLTATQQKYQ